MAKKTCIVVIVILALILLSIAIAKMFQVDSKLILFFLIVAFLLFILLKTLTEKEETILPLLINAILALATIVLVMVTYNYVELTRELVKKQDQSIENQTNQFVLVNRAKVECNRIVGSETRGGSFELENSGNLTANNLQYIWQIIETNTTGGVDNAYPSSISIKTINELKPDESHKVAYKSGYKNENQNVFMIIVWKYNGPGIKSYVIRDCYYYWNALNPWGPMWVRNNTYLGAEHDAIVRKVIDEHRKKLEAS